MNSNRVARRIVGIAGLALGTVAMAGCTNARLVGVWSDPDYNDAPARSMLVVSQRKDPVDRRLWEDEVRASLQKSGVDAVASYTLFPDGVPSQQALQQALEDRNLDAALVLKPLRATRETRWVPGWNTIAPREYYNPWNGRSAIVYTRRRSPGYRVTDRTLREQVTVWTASDGGQMVWAATVEADNPGSADNLRRDIGAGVVPGLRKAGVI